jgi:hypothetical protein
MTKKIVRSGVNVRFLQKVRPEGAFYEPCGSGRHDAHALLSIVDAFAVWGARCTVLERVPLLPQLECLLGTSSARATPQQHTLHLR